MRYKIYLSVMMAGLLAFASCKVSKAPQTAPFKESVTVGDEQMQMVELKGGTFAMGCLPDGRMLEGSTSQHQEVIAAYAIAADPVSPRLWKAIMGKEGKISLEQAETFAAIVARKTGLPVHVATEAEWEFALKSGAIHTIKGIRELTAPGVARTATSREEVEPFLKAGDFSFRLAWDTGEDVPPEVWDAIVEKISVREAYTFDPSCPKEVITVNGVPLCMIGIEGGVFDMGATPTQADYASDDERPVQHVFVTDFRLGETEVTVGQWLAVMGRLPFGNDPKALDMPVGNVSWYGAQEFILKLNELTHRSFRLPTEEEWEFAARGGKKTVDYRFAGSWAVAQVAVHTIAGSEKPLGMKPVKSLKPNGLGLYDMSGNAWEWCQNGFYEYGKEPTDETGEWRMMRGGSAASHWDACRVSNRSKIPASTLKSTFGFRLAL